MQIVCQTGRENEKKNDLGPNLLYIKGLNLNYFGVSMDDPVPDRRMMLPFGNTMLRFGNI